MIPTLLLCLAVIGFCSIDRSPQAQRRRQLKKSMRGNRIYIPWGVK